MEQYLRIPEIFEHILVHLPIEDLLRYQLVSKSFKDTIDNSPAIQQALFFRARPARVGATVEVNALLAIRFPFWFFDDGEKYRGHSRLDFAGLHGDHETLDKRGTGTEWKPNSKIQDAILRKDASWRRMFVTQPPAAILIVSDRRSAMGGTGIASGIIRYDTQKGDGLRMAELYDLAEEHVFRHLVCGFQVIWDLPSSIPALNDASTNRDYSIEKVVDGTAAAESSDEVVEKSQKWIIMKRTRVQQCTGRVYQGERIFRSEGYQAVQMEDIGQKFRRRGEQWESD